MNAHLSYVDDISDIRQGDIIRRFPQGDESKPVWGFVVTADCDIANRKARDRYTWLEIVRSVEFLEVYWATDALRRHLETQARLGCDAINAMIRKSRGDLREIIPHSLCEWLKESTPEEVLLTVGAKTASSDARLLSSLHSIRIALGVDAAPSQIERLKLSWTQVGRDEKSQQAAIRDGFKGDGFPDFVLVPELPKTTGCGFVILLRSINSVATTDVFLNETDARINGRLDGFHRIGRFCDSLRFSVSQKLAFLFSRIGMSGQFEADCRVVTDLLIEDIYGLAGASK